MSYTVAQNTSFFTIASVLQKVVSFIYFALIARLIGVENTGIYFFAIAYTTIFIVLADFGLGTAFTRQAARKKEGIMEVLNTLLSTKILFGLITYLVVIVSVNLLNYSEITKNLIYISGITMFFDNLHNIFYALFRARKNLFFESLGIIGSQIITLTIGTIALVNGWPLYWLILAYTIPSIINLIYSSTIAILVYEFKIKLVFSFTIFRDFLLIAWPFALAGAIMRLFAYSDSLLMSKMLSIQDLGLWSVTYKMSSAFYFLAIALSSSVYPVFSSLYESDKKRLAPLFEKSYRYLLFVSLPITAGIFVLADPVIKAVYGSAYVGSILPLKILIISITFTFLSYINGALLNAVNKQKTQTTLLAIALVISIFINILLIPVIGIVGAATAAVLSSIWLTKTGYYFCSRVIKIRHITVMKYFYQTFFPALIMAICVHYLAKYINFAYTIPIGAIVYLFFVNLTGGLSKETIIRTKNKLFKKI